MRSSSTDRDWQKLGSTEPYFAVLTDVRFARAAEPGPDRDAFFLSGETDVARVFAAVRAHVAPDFAPERALDFGCGVGRLVVPLARRVREVVGVDVAPGMVAEARRNVAEAGLANVALSCLRDVREIEGSFDLIHSWIVFQHIRPKAGLAIARELLTRLRPGGVAALHFVYALDKPLWWRIAYTLRKRAPGLHALANVLKRRSPARPIMEMNAYSLPRLLALARGAGAQHVTLALTDHDGCLGALLLFARPR